MDKISMKILAFIYTIHNIRKEIHTRILNATLNAENPLFSEFDPYFSK